MTAALQSRHMTEMLKADALAEGLTTQCAWSAGAAMTRTLIWLPGTVPLSLPQLHKHWQDCYVRACMVHPDSQAGVGLDLLTCYEQ